jgi:hypothetical protein
MLASLPAYVLGGPIALVHSAVAALLCLLPTALALAWCHTTFSGAPEQLLVAVLGGTVLRIVFVVSIGLVLFHTTEAFHDRAFWFWVIAAYLVTLGLEVMLLVKRQSSSGTTSPIA